jgi:fluoride exporter
MSRRRPPDLVAVAFGGMLGAPARYGLSRLWPTTGNAFPWSTLLINLTGSAALGCFVVLALARFPRLRPLRPLVATGFLGAYTTYSTFAVETDLLIQHFHAGTAFIYVLASLVGGVLAAATGMATARWAS